MGEEVVLVDKNMANGNYLVDIGERLARGDELERFVAGIIHPRYKLAGDWVRAKLNLKRKEEESGKAELNKVISDIKKKKDQILKEPEKAKELVKEINELKNRQEKLSKKVREAIKEEKERKKEIEKAIKEKDAQAEIALVMLGYQL